MQRTRETLRRNTRTCTWSSPYNLLEYSERRQVTCGWMASSYSWYAAVVDLSFAPALKDQRPISSTESKAVGERVIECHLARLIGNVIQIAFRILIKDVNSRRQDLIAERKHCDSRFQSAGPAEQVSSHGFR